MDAREAETGIAAGDASRQTRPEELSPAEQAAVVLGIVGMLAVVLGGLSVLLL